VAGLLVISVH